jgi:ribosomal protein L33
LYDIKPSLKNIQLPCENDEHKEYTVKFLIYGVENNRRENAQRLSLANSFTKTLTPNTAF